MTSRKKGRTGWASIGAALIMSGTPLAAGAQGPQSLLDRPARLSVAGVSVEEGLRALQRASGVALAFSPDLLPTGRLVSCACLEITVRAALDRLLEGTDLEYRAGRRQVLIGRRSSQAGTPSEPPVSGIVVDAALRRPVPAAEVRVVGGRAATLTGDDGRFRLAGLNGSSQLLISSIGYQPRTIRVASPETPLRVELDATPIPLDEVVIAPGRLGVLEVSPTLSGSVVSREDIEAIPQIGDDVFRTLKRMPGVVAEDISTRLNVRGGTDRDLLVHLDGLELYEPYHLKDLDGALGMVDVQSLGGIDLVTGGFSAEHGDKTAGVFDMYTRPPPTEGSRTTLGLSLSSVSAISQGSFAAGRGQWLASLRRGFLEYVLAITDVDDDLDPRYWDALGRLQYLISEDHLVWAELLYGSDDLVWSDDDTSSRVTSAWTSGYAWVGWKATWAERVRSETLVSLGRLTRDRIGLVDNAEAGPFTPLSADVDDVASTDFFGAKQDWQLDLSSNLMLKAGIDARTIAGDYDYFGAASRYDLTPDNQIYVRYDTTEVVVDPSGAEVGSYMALRGRTGSHLTWEAGVRHDWQEHTGDGDLAPRLLLRFDWDERTSLRGSWGRYFQSQGVHELHVRDGETSFAGSEMATQLAFGIERSFDNGVSGRLEGYYRSISEPLPLYVNLSRSVNPVLEVESDRRRIVPSRARSRGLELVLSQDGTGPGSWSVSYGLARAEDRVDGAWAPRTLDQLHTLNLRGAYRFGGSWQLSGTWSYHTGWPFTEQLLDVEVGLNEDGSEQVDVIRRGFGDYNDGRLPAYHRLDVRVTRSFDLRRSRLEVYLDVFNAYNRTNLRGYHWNLRGSSGRYTAQRSTGEEQLPILPTIGLRWVF
jgi:hypothetical protein